MFIENLIFDWSGFIILIVEDDVSSTFYLKEIIKETHANILHASDGLKAVEICRNEKSINLVLMDIVLPYMNGLDATRAIRKINPSLPVIAHSADVIEHNRKACFSEGCNDFLAKPVDPVELLQIISKYLKQH